MELVVAHEFMRWGHKIEILQEKRSKPGVSSFEERLGIEVRYALRFDGEITDWSDFVEALVDEPSTIRLAHLGEERAKKLAQETTSESTPD